MQFAAAGSIGNWIFCRCAGNGGPYGLEQCSNPGCGQGHSVSQVKLSICRMDIVKMTEGQSFIFFDIFSGNLESMLVVQVYGFFPVDHFFQQADLRLIFDVADRQGADTDCTALGVR